jgi:hypothetical protein
MSMEIVRLDRPVARLRAVAEALEEVAAALSSADADRLDACEGPLDAAVASMPAPAELSMSDSAVIRPTLVRIREALALCRALGAATTELAMVSLSAQGMAPGYLPAGLGVPAPRQSRLEARV